MAHHAIVTSLAAGCLLMLAAAFTPARAATCLNFEGSPVFNNVTVEIGGTTPCAEHDRTNVEQTLTFAGGVLTLELSGGFTPAPGSRFDVFDWRGAVVGTFAALDTSNAPLPDGLQWSLVDLYTTGELLVTDGSGAPVEEALPLPLWLYPALGLLLAQAARPRKHQQTKDRDTHEFHAGNDGGRQTLNRHQGF